MTSKKPHLKVDAEIDTVNWGIEESGLDDVLDDNLDDTLLEEAVDVVEKPERKESEKLEELEELEVKPKTDLPDIAHMIRDLNDINDHLTVLVYGRNGCGKTTFLATAGEGTLLLTTDDGILSVKTSKNEELRKLVRERKIKEVPITKWEDFESLYWFLKSGKPLLSGEGIEVYLPGTGKFVIRSIAIDTITKLQDICMRSVVLGEAAKDASKDVLSPTVRDWGIMSQKMRYWLAAYKDLPVYKLWACQERTNTDDLELDGFLGFPDLSKSLRNFVCGEADIIGRMHIKQVESNKVQFRMLVGANQSYVTKDRTNRLGYAIANPKFSIIKQKLEEGDE